MRGSALGICNHCDYVTVRQIGESMGFGGLALVFFLQCFYQEFQALFFSTATAGGVEVHYRMVWNLSRGR